MTALHEIPPLPRHSSPDAAHVAAHLDADADARAVARVVADHRSLWAPHVRFDPQAPHRAVVWTDERWLVELGAWLPGQGSTARERVERPGALLVLQGRLEETTWHVATDGPSPGVRTSVTRVHGQGQMRTHGRVHVHSVAAAGPDPVLALQVHAR